MAEEKTLAKALKRVWDYTTQLNEELPLVVQDAYVELIFSDFSEEIYLRLQYHPDQEKEPRFIPLATDETDLERMSVDEVLDIITRHLS